MVTIVGRIIVRGINDVSTTISAGNIVALRRNWFSTKVGLVIGVGRTVPVSRPISREISIIGTSIVEKTVLVNEGVVHTIDSTTCNGLRTSEGMDCVGKGINGISVVERLSTKDFEKKGIADKGRTVVYVLIGLDDPDKFLDRVVEVKFDFVTGRTDRLVTSELKLGDQVFVRVLGHSSALISI
jgi:hypothetical protein